MVTQDPPLEEQPKSAEVGLVPLASRGLPEWLTEQKVSLAFTASQAGKLFLVGLQPDGRLSIFERSVPRCMGLTVSATGLYVASLFQVWRFESTQEPGGDYSAYDRLFAPRMSWVTGDLDIHDIALDKAERPIFANTLFSCIASTSEEGNFAPLWRPPFISKLAAEDRCHLNGLALKDGVPAYVTVVARSDVADGWRDHRRNGGLLIDVASGENVVAGLSMPHSPRMHDGEVYLTNAGTGEFGRVDLKRGAFEPIAFCPGYLRGLAFSGRFAIVTVSLPREDGAFQGLALDDQLRGHGAEPRCGLMVIDLSTGDTVHWLRLNGVVKELYDVAVLPEVRRPAAIGFKNDEIRHVFKIAESQLR